MAFKTITQLFDLQNQTAIVSGGSMGIGRSIVDRLSEAGAAVVIADIDIERGEQTKKEFTEKGRKVEFIATDVSNLEDIQSHQSFH